MAAPGEPAREPSKERSADQTGGPAGARTGRPPRPRRRAFAIVLALVVAYEAYAFFMREAGDAENIASPSDWHLTGEVAGDIALEQSLVPHADGFDGLDLWAHATSDTPPGSMVVTILSIGTGLDRITQVPVPAADVIATRPFHVTIPRIDQSAGHSYLVRISVPQATRGHGLRFEASGPAYPQGSMTLGGREEWGDLQFRTSAERTTIYRNLRHLRQSPQVPAFARSDLFFVLMFVIFNLSLAVVLDELAFAHADADADANASA